jgi:hypothetical protein
MSNTVQSRSRRKPRNDPSPRGSTMHWRKCAAVHRSAMRTKKSSP